MADYKVGNLQIAFEAIDKTSADFKELAKNLRALQKLITNIGNADITPFVNNIKAFRKEMSPLLTKIQGASQGIADLNSVAKQFGIRNISKAVQELQGVANVASEATESVKDINEAIDRYDDRLQQTSNSLALVATEQSRVSVAWDNLNRLMSFNSYDKILASVGGLAHEWRNLYTTLSIFGEKGDQVTKGMFSAEAEERLRSISQRYFQQKEIIEQTNRAFREMEETYRRSKMTAEELTIEEYRQVEASRKQRIEFLQAALALGKAGDNADAYKKELADLTNEQEKNNKATKKSISRFGKLFNSLKRIAFYRLIRTVLKEITQSLQEGVKAFAQVDNKVNDTMSKLTSSLSVIKLSFTATLIPLLEIITPIIQQIGVALANVANMVSQAMSKTGTYTKINTDLIKNYREELEKTGSLADFDKIRALNTSSGGLSDFLIPNEEVDESNKRLTKLRETFDKLAIIITSVFNIIQKVGKVAFDTLLDVLNAVLDVITPLIEGISNFITKLDEMGLLEPIIKAITYALLGMGAVKVINGIKNVASAISSLNFQSLALYAAIGFLIYAIVDFVNSLDDISSAAKVLIPIVSLLIGLTAAYAVAKAAAAAGIAAPAMALVTAGAIAAAIAMVAGTAIAKSTFSGTNSSSTGGSRPRAYANGGTVPYGTLFYAGEAGAETVTVGSSGRTEVTNVSQMETALYNALVRYGRENRGSDNAININIDGQKVFEVVQRTANKKGLGFSRI